MGTQGGVDAESRKEPEALSPSEESPAEEFAKLKTPSAAVTGAEPVADVTAETPTEPPIAGELL